MRSQIICSLLRDWHICTIQCNCVQRLSLNLSKFFLAENAGRRLWEFKLLQLRQTIENGFIVHCSGSPLKDLEKKRNLMDILSPVITKKSWILMHKEPCFYYSTVWLDRGKKSMLLLLCHCPCSYQHQQTLFIFLW